LAQIGADGVDDLALLRRPRRNQAHPAGAGAVAGFRQHQDRFARRVVAGHWAAGILVTLLFSLFPEEGG
jgi:hypothetical protein